MREYSDQITHAPRLETQAEADAARESRERFPIRLWERREGYEASFRLAFRGLDHQVPGIVGAFGGLLPGSTYRGSLLPPVFFGVDAQSRLDLVYTCAPNALGVHELSWHIEGVAAGAEAPAALAGARRIFENVRVALGALHGGLVFEPVPDDDADVRPPAPYRVRVEPMTIGIGSPSAVRGLSEVGRPVRDDLRDALILVPATTGQSTRLFDTVLSTAHASRTPITIRIGITPHRLSAAERSRMRLAATRLALGGSDGEALTSDADLDLNDPDKRAWLGDHLRMWLHRPSGFAISCTCEAERPIPPALLNLVGNAVFPHRQVVSREVAAGIPASGTVTVRPVRIDLSGSINEAVRFPAFLPSPATLARLGVPRCYERMPRRLAAGGLLLGTVGTTGAEVRIAKGDRQQHLYLAGATGTGKSTLLHNLIAQDIRNGEGVCVIDPHGDLYRDLLGEIPAERANDVVLFDPCDLTRAPGLNFLQCDGAHQAREMGFAVNEMIRIFDRLYDLKATGGPIFEMYMRSTLLLLMDNDDRDATLADVPLVFEDAGFRKHLLERCHNPFVKSFWTGQAEAAGGDLSLKNVAPYITSKLNQFTANALLRPIVGNPRSTIDFRRVMDEGGILLVNLSKGLLGDLDSRLLGMLLIGKLFNAAMGRAGCDRKERRPFYLYVDEFQNFATDTVAHLLSEARKFGLYLTLANQHLAQLSAHGGRHDLLASVLGNVGSTLFFRVGPQDAERLEPYTMPELLGRDLQDLPNFHVAARLMNGGVPGRPFVFRTHPAPAAPMSEAPQREIARMVQASRERYTVETAEVEARIAARRTAHKKQVSEGGTAKAAQAEAGGG